MPKLPLVYEVTLERSSPTPFLLRAADRPPIGVGPPVDFGGNDMQWSPEHLLVSATVSCFTATFFAMAKRAEVKVGHYTAVAEGILDRGLSPKGTMGFTMIELVVDLTVLGSDVERMKHMLEEAKRNCFVANSLRCNVELIAHVHAS